MNRRPYLLGMLLQWLIAHIARHPFLYGSALVHVLAIGTFFYFQSDHLPGMQRYVNTPVQQAQVAASLEKTYARATQKRIEDMHKIKELLEQSTGDKPVDTAPIAEPSTSAAPLDVKKPADLAEEANKLAQQIQQLQQKNKAKELARLLKIPEADALKKVQQEQPPLKLADAKKMDDKQLTASVAQLQETAKTALRERQRQLAREQNGVQVAGGDAGAGQQGAAGGLSGLAGHGQGEGLGQGLGGKAGGYNASIVNHRINRYLNADSIAVAANVESTLLDMGDGHIPSISRQPLRKNTGRILGAGGEYSNRFYLNSWYIIGPFDSSSGLSNAVYPPEQAIDLDAVYRGKYNRLLQWQYFTTDTYPLIPPDLAENAIYYAYTEVKVDAEQDLWAWIGADDKGAIWLNDYMVYNGSSRNKQWYFDQVYFGGEQDTDDWNLTEAKRLLHFQQGRNSILFKLTNYSAHGFFSLVLTKQP